MFIEKLEKETSRITNEKGAVAYSTTLNPLYDFFGQAGSMRHASPGKILELFARSLDFDRGATIRLLFYFRDVRGGQGERRLFRLCMIALAEWEPEYVRTILHLIPEYGRWDDLIYLWDNALQESVAEACLETIREQLIQDCENCDKGKPVSLLGKWLPSENTSSKETRRLANRLRKELGMSSKGYRQTLSKLRKAIKVVERDMSANRWDEINYEHVPSRANVLYNAAFLRHDLDRRQEYLRKVQQGNAKVNASVLYPYEIVSRVLNTRQKDLNLENAWNNLPDYVQSDENALVVADVSGSMFMDGNPRPIDVSISLALYYAERNTGKFHDMFMTFSGRPKLVKIVGNTITERIKFIEKAEWGFNTDILALFKVFIEAAKDCPKDEIPTRLYIISDMQFDAGCKNVPPIEEAKGMFEEAEVPMPQLIFWNVNARDGGIPITKDDRGWIMVSGCSPSILKFIMKTNIQIEDFFKQVINEILQSDRYISIPV